MIFRIVVIDFWKYYHSLQYNLELFFTQFLSCNLFSAFQREICDSCTTPIILSHANYKNLKYLQSLTRNFHGVSNWKSCFRCHN